LVIIEGIDVKAKKIPKKQLVSSWKLLSKKPLPKIIALQLKDNDFNRVICLRRCVEDMQRELDEWGYILTTEGTDACVFNAEEKSGSEYIILIREKPYHNLKTILTHELTHIVEGDL